MSAAWALDLSSGSSAPIASDQPASPGPGQYGDSADARQFRWLGKDYDRCDQFCLLNKADNVLSVGELTRAKRLDELTLLFGNYKSQPNDSVAKDQLVKGLGAYCVAGETANVTGLTTCFKRYTWAELATMRKAAASLHDIKRARNALESGSLADGQAQAIARNAFKIAETKPQYYQTAYVPTFDELNQKFKSDSNLLRSMTTQEYVQWQAELEKAPSCDEFVKTEEYELDGAKHLRVVLDAQGNPALDPVKCKKMQAEHLAQAEKYHSDFEAIGKDLTAPKTRPTSGIKSLEEASHVSVTEYKDAEEMAVAKVKERLQAEIEKSQGPGRKPTSFTAKDKGDKKSTRGSKLWGNAKIDPVVSEGAHNVNELSYEKDIEDEMSGISSAIDDAMKKP